MNNTGLDVALLGNESRAYTDTEPTLLMIPAEQIARVKGLEAAGTTDFLRVDGMEFAAQRQVRPRAAQALESCIKL